MDPEFIVAMGTLLATYYDMRDYPRALETMRRMAELTGSLEEYEEERAVYESSGWQGLLERWVAENEADHTTGQRRAISMAADLSQLGRQDEALDWLEIALESWNPGLRYLKLDPAFDTLRDHPRFIAIERAVGFPDS
jgi:adenylate cyclase